MRYMNLSFPTQPPPFLPCFFTFFRAGKNRLRGTIPTELFLLTTLRTLELEGNELESTIPTEICQLENLHSLHLGRNQFSGEVSV